MQNRQPLVANFSKIRTTEVPFDVMPMILWATDKLKEKRQKEFAWETKRQSLLNGMVEGEDILHIYKNKQNMYFQDKYTLLLDALYFFYCVSVNCKFK